LLTPGTAFADTAVATTTAITGTSQSPDSAGTTTLNVRVSVTPASGTAWPAGTVKVTDTAGDSCTVTLAQDGSSAAGVGSCNLTGLAGGFYKLTASYAGSSAFSASVSDRDTVYIKHRHADLATRLSCTSKVYSGKDGACTLSVTNAGSFAAPDVTAQVNLPSQLRALHCNSGWWNRGCTISHNTASESFATLKPGQTRTLTVVFAAKTSHALWGWHRFHSIIVKVTGSAASNQGWYGFNGPGSHSTAYVKIVPRGWWWAF
jgi:Bacterial Ig-like domain (group 3)/Domain of unknown function DUF11